MHPPDLRNADPTPGTAWVRTSLNECRELETGRSLDAGSRTVIDFAIRWAPFGGATAEELFAHFGVTRPRFWQLVSTALTPRSSDDPRARHLKRRLLLALAQAWRVDAGVLGRPS